jgi:hypothetical protein
MPLCKFPEEASYSGSGNVYSAANWSCDPSDTRMLAVGVTGLASGGDTATALLLEDCRRDTLGPTRTGPVAFRRIVDFGALIEEVRFAEDSPLEQSGFEL